MLKRRVVRRTTARKPVRKTTTRRKGNWSFLGLHGGKEGKQWTRGKRIVAKAAAMIQTQRNGIKADAALRVSKLTQVNLDDKRRLLREINGL